MAYSCMLYYVLTMFYMLKDHKACSNRGFAELVVSAFICIRSAILISCLSLHWHFVEQIWACRLHAKPHQWQSKLDSCNIIEYVRILESLRKLPELDLLKFVTLIICRVCNCKINVSNILHLIWLDLVGLHCIALHFTISLHYISLHCIALHFTGMLDKNSTI